MAKTTPTDRARALILASLAAEGVPEPNPVMVLTAARCLARLDRVVAYIDGLPDQSDGEDEALLVKGSRRNARPHPLLVQENLLRNELRMHMVALRDGRPSKPVESGKPVAEEGLPPIARIPRAASAR